MFRLNTEVIVEVVPLHDKSVKFFHIIFDIFLNVLHVREKTKTKNMLVSELSDTSKLSLTLKHNRGCV